MASYKITIDKRSGTGGTDALWYDTVSATFYADEGLTEPVEVVSPPSRECWSFNGIFSATSGGTKYFDEFGNITDELRDLSIRAAKTFYAQWTQVSYKLTLDDNNGSGGSGALFWKIDTEDTERLYLDDLCTSPASSVATPFRSAYAFDGYYNGTSTPGAKYVNADGSFAEALTELVLSGDKTIHARWVAAYKITVSANSGTGGTTAFYYDSLSAKFYDGPDLQNAITAIVPHVRSQYALLGFMATNSNTGVLRVGPDGSIAAGWVPTASATIYARWSQISYKITVSKNGGTGGTYTFFAKIGATDDKFFADDLCTDAISSVALPTRPGYVIMGVYNSTSGSTKYIGRDGRFTSALQALAVTSNKTIYARWIPVYKITLSKQSGEGGGDALFYNSIEDSFFADPDLTVPASSVDIPSRECHRFDGYYNSTSGSTKYIGSDGRFTDALRDLSITSAKTFYAKWTRVSLKLTLDDNRGSDGSGGVYFDGEINAFFSDYMLMAPATGVAVPVRPGYDFAGYYSTSASSGGSRYVDETGRIVVATALTAAATVYARWLPRTYTLTFDYNGGNGSVQSKSVTMGAAVGTLPGAASDFGTFDGWYVGDTKLTTSLEWDFPADTVAIARWKHYFGNLTDWFGLETANGPLMLVSSNAGETRAVIETSHSGAIAIKSDDSAVGAFELGGILLNPTCTYRIRKQGKVRINLGKAYGSATVTGSGTSSNPYRATKSGYMLVQAAFSSSADGEPLLTVTGAANEGYVWENGRMRPTLTDAINRWYVDLTVGPDHIAQDPMNAVNGGGEMTECKTLFTCDPVVPTEKGMPCASDVVRGKIVVTANTTAYFGESAPTARSPFVETNGVPGNESDVDFTTYSITAERSL